MYTWLGTIVKPKIIYIEIIKDMGWFHLPNRTQYISACLDQSLDLTWGQVFLYMTRRETDKTDELHQVTPSCSDNPARLD